MPIFQVKYAQAQEAHYTNIFLLTNNTDIVLDLQYYLNGIFNWKMLLRAVSTWSSLSKWVIHELFNE